MDITPLIEIYKKSGVYKEKDDELTLHESCLHREKCWKNRKKQGCKDNKISHPYIGEEYKNQLLGIGKNLYEYGGW